MAMIKRATTGQIEEMIVDGEVKEQAPNIEWNTDVLIKDVLEVPTRSETKIDVDLESDDEDEIAVRV